MPRPAIWSTSRATSGTRSGNAGDEPCRILEIIAPGGFEDFFDELVDAGAAGPPEPEWLAGLGARYGLEFDFASIPGLCERFGVRFG